jgi:hypothetical protein
VSLQCLTLHPECRQVYSDSESTDSHWWALRYVMKRDGHTPTSYSMSFASAAEALPHIQELLGEDQ